MKRILITNDDGITSAGIRALERALPAAGEIYTVAPVREMSAAAHSISLRDPVTVQEVGVRRWAVEGTPADSVIVALRRVLPFVPDLVVSGINHGDNLGPHVYYSGTVSAAAEATLSGIPSIAVSLCSDGEFDFTQAAAFTAQLAALVLKTGLPEGVLLNVNVPPHCNNGARLTRMGRRVAEDRFVKSMEPDERKHYWIHERADIAGMSESDYVAVHHGTISVTPLMLDRTDGRSAQVLDQWLRAYRPESHRPE